MNNRIMAMLFALVAAMFISIVPVKAEAAATCNSHTDTDHNYSCDTVGCSEHVHHADVTVEAKDATCKEAGTEKYFICNGCKQISKFVNFRETTTLEAVTIAKLETHTVDTYVNQGAQQHWGTCKVCGTTVKENHFTNQDCTCDAVGCNAAVHDLERIAANAATCTATGNVEYYHCKRCNKCFTDATAATELANSVTEATGHNYGKAQPVEGHTYHEKVCETCDYKRQFDCTSTDKDCLCDECGTLVKHVVSNMEQIARVEATCEKDGNIGYNKCKTCGRPFSVNGDVCTLYTGEIVIDALGHKFLDSWGWEETEDGTGHFKYCANEGCGAHLYGTAKDVKVGEQVHTHGSWYYNNTGDHCEICAICGKGYNDAKHDYSEISRVEALSGANKKQQHLKTCECGAYMYEECVFDANCLCETCGTMKTHEWSSLTGFDGTPATCTTAGKEFVAQCATCKGLFQDDHGKVVSVTEADIVIPALGHNWVPDTTMDEVEGRHIMKCSNTGCTKGTVMNHYTKDNDCYCDVPDCNVIAHSHKHIYVAAVPATCVDDGAEAYYYYQDCGKKFDLNENPIDDPATIEATGHDLSENWVPGENGKHVKECANCDYFEAEDHVFIARSVTCSVCGAEEGLTHVAAKAAECTESGNVEYWYSKVTGKMYADEAGTRQLTSVTIAATGHDMSGWEDAGDGLNHKQVCMNDGCDRELTEAHDGSKGCFCAECYGALEGHELSSVAMVPASCSKAGTQAYFKCSCNKLYDLGYNLITAPKAIAQLNHDVSGAEIQKDAKEGKHYMACNDCGYRFYEEHLMIVEDPLKGNYHQQICECGELEIETHYDKNGDNKCDVCDHSMTSTTAADTKVEQHDNVTVYTGDSDTVKPTQSWWQNWLEVLTPSNSGGTSSTEQTVVDNTNNGGADNGNIGSQSENNGSAQQRPAAPEQNTNSGAVETNVIMQFISWFLGLFGF